MFFDFPLDGDGVFLNNKITYDVILSFVAFIAIPSTFSRASSQENTKQSAD